MHVLHLLLLDDALMSDVCRSRILVYSHRIDWLQSRRHYGISIVHSRGPAAGSVTVKGRGVGASHAAQLLSDTDTSLNT